VSILAERVMPHRFQFVASFVALALCFAGVYLWCRGRPNLAATAAPAEVPADWDMADLLRRLGPLDLQVLPTNCRGPLEDGVYLTVAGKGWEDVSRLSKLRGPMHAWRGTVQVLRANRPPDVEPFDPSRRCWFRAGRFFFYGDPDLLDRVEEVLRAQAGAATPPGKGPDKTPVAAKSPAGFGGASGPVGACRSVAVA
jgi:hypothetical protein